MLLKVRNLTRTSSGKYRYRRVVPADCRSDVGKTEWLKSFGKIPDDVATAHAAALNAEYDELVRAIRAERNGTERELSEAEQAVMGVLGLSDAAQLEALTTVAELFKDLTTGKSGPRVAAQMAPLKTAMNATSGALAAAEIQPEKISDIYAEDQRL